MVDKPSSAGSFSRAGHFVRAVLPGIGGAAALLLIWHFFVLAFSIPMFLLPSPYDVWETIPRLGHAWYGHIWATVRATLVGFAVAAVVGLGLAVMIVQSQFLSRVLTPIIVILQIIPKIAFAPLLLIWLGSGLAPIVVIVFLVAFFPMVVNAVVGMDDVEPDLIDLTRVLHLSWWRVLWTIRLPNAMPHIFSGLRVASTLAVIGAIIGEFVGSNVGLGYLILIANNQLDTPLAFAAILMISIFGLMLYGFIALVEGISMPWRSRSGSKPGLSI